MPDMKERPHRGREPHIQRLAATCRRFVTPSDGVACVLSAISFAEQRT